MQAADDLAAMHVHDPELHGLVDREVERFLRQKYDLPTSYNNEGSFLASRPNSPSKQQSHKKKDFLGRSEYDGRGGEGDLHPLTSDELRAREFNAGSEVRRLEQQQQQLQQQRQCPVTAAATTMTSAEIPPPMSAAAARSQALKAKLGGQLQMDFASASALMALNGPPSPRLGAEAAAFLVEEKEATLAALYAQVQSVVASVKKSNKIFVPASLARKLRQVRAPLLSGLGFAAEAARVRSSGQGSRAQGAGVGGLLPSSMLFGFDAEAEHVKQVLEQQVRHLIEQRRMQREQELFMMQQQQLHQQQEQQEQAQWQQEHEQHFDHQETASAYNADLYEEAKQQHTPQHQHHSHGFQTPPRPTTAAASRKQTPSGLSASASSASLFLYASPSQASLSSPSSATAAAKKLQRSGSASALGSAAVQRALIQQWQPRTLSPFVGGGAFERQNVLPASSNATTPIKLKLNQVMSPAGQRALPKLSPSPSTASLADADTAAAGLPAPGSYSAWRAMRHGGGGGGGGGVDRLAQHLSLAMQPLLVPADAPPNPLLLSPSSSAASFAHLHHHNQRPKTAALRHSASAAVLGSYNSAATLAAAGAAPEPNFVSSFSPNRSTARFLEHNRTMRPSQLPASPWEAGLAAMDAGATPNGRPHTPSTQPRPLSASTTPHHQRSSSAARERNLIVDGAVATPAAAATRWGWPGGGQLMTQQQDGSGPASEATLNASASEPNLTNDASAASAANTPLKQKEQLRPSPSAARFAVGYTPDRASSAATGSERPATAADASVVLDGVNSLPAAASEASFADATPVMMRKLRAQAQAVSGSKSAAGSRPRTAATMRPSASMSTLQHTEEKEQAPSYPTPARRRPSISSSPSSHATGLELVTHVGLVTGSKVAMKPKIGYAALAAAEAAESADSGGNVGDSAIKHSRPTSAHHIASDNELGAWNMLPSATMEQHNKLRPISASPSRAQRNYDKAVARRHVPAAAAAGATSNSSLSSALSTTGAPRNANYTSSSAYAAYHPAAVTASPVAPHSVGPDAFPVHYITPSPAAASAAGNAAVAASSTPQRGVSPVVAPLRMAPGSPGAAAAAALVPLSVGPSTPKSPLSPSARGMAAAPASLASVPLEAEATAVAHAPASPTTESYFRAPSSRPSSASLSQPQLSLGASGTAVVGSPSARERRLMKVERAADPSLVFSPPSSEREVHRTNVLPLSQAEVEARKVKTIAPKQQPLLLEEDAGTSASVSHADADEDNTAAAPAAVPVSSPTDDDEAAAMAAAASFVPSHQVRWADANTDSAAPPSASAASTPLSSPSRSRLSSASSMRAQLQAAAPLVDEQLASFARPSSAQLRLGNSRTAAVPSP
jgi:hypothetical protein